MSGHYRKGGLSSGVAFKRGSTAVSIIAGMLTKQRINETLINKSHPPLILCIILLCVM